MSLPVGARISVDKCKATVRYVGSIEGQRGTWVGLDWDDAERGRHDGSTGGRRYFMCSGTASSGSFVREAKLLQVAELGVCLPTAIERRCALRVYSIRFCHHHLVLSSLPLSICIYQLDSKMRHSCTRLRTNLSLKVRICIAEIPQTETGMMQVQGRRRKQHRQPGQPSSRYCWAAGHQAAAGACTGRHMLHSQQ